MIFLSFFYEKIRPAGRKCTAYHYSAVCIIQQAHFVELLLSTYLLLYRDTLEMIVAARLIGLGFGFRGVDDTVSMMSR